MTYDLIVAGCGVMGSAVALHAARRGMRVLAIDRHQPPHDLGSSHGRTRLIREAYYEHPLYVPLVRRAYALWREMEEATGARLLTRTGSLMLGTDDSEIVRGTLRSAREHAVPHALLSADEVRREFPAFTPLDDMVAVHEPGSSLLHPEEVVRHQIALSVVAGAEFRANCRALYWKCVDNGVMVVTSDGSIHAGQLVLAAGAWTPGLLPHLPHFEVERQLQQWWTPARDAADFRGDRMPVSMWQLADGRIFYTMPDLGDGVKLGWHHNGPIVDPDQVDRTASTRENAELCDLLRRFLPHAKGERRRSAVCFYTNTPDGHFLIDRHPTDTPVWILSACSGHGFKFAPTLGEAMAQLLTGETPAFDLSPFRLGRLTA